MSIFRLTGPGDLSEDKNERRHEEEVSKDPGDGVTEAHCSEPERADHYECNEYPGNHLHHS